MKRFLYSLLCTLLCVAANAQFDSAPAFPGAEGHGRYTTGGRGGTVVHVTNLNDSGEGSFRAAVSGSSKKIVVFDVGGVIALTSDLTIGANTTILGQTAPSPGITLRYYTVRPSANNIIRYIRIRRGQEKDVNEGADATWQRQVTGLILDHCSFSWSIDEVASFYDNNNFTMQWCTIGEALNNAGHGKGAHGYGGIWGGKLASFHHNMLIHLNNRVPRFNGARYNWDGYTSNKEYSKYNWQNAVQSENVDFRNCVMYNWGDGNGCYGGPGGGQINIVNNYYKAGPATSNKTRVTQISKGESGNIGDDQTFINMTSRYYINGNYVTAASSPANYDWSGVIYDQKSYSSNGEYYTPDAGNYYNAAHTTINSTSCVRIKMDSPAPTGSISTHSATEAYSKVLDYAGASLYRDNVDERYAREISNNNPEYTGSVSNKKGIIDIVSDVNGYTEANFGIGTRPANYDTDKDGIPDAWETTHGLAVGVNNATTYNLDSQNYYTDLEVYANYLVQHITKAERAGATETFEEYYPLGDDPSALLPTTITATPASVSITGTASATVTLSSNNSEGAYSISSAPNSAVATATISGNTITITGVAAGTTSLTVSQDASSTHKAGTKTISIMVSAEQGGGSTEEFHAVTSSEETILLTKANIEANNYLSAGTDNWNTGKTYGSVSGDFYNMSTSDRTITIKLTDCSKVKFTVQNSTNGRTYSYSINGGEAVTVTHGGTGVETTSEIEVPSGNVTIVLKGGGSSVYPVSIIAYKREPSRDTSYDKNLGNNTYVVAEGDKAVSGTQIKGTDITMTYGNDTWKDAATESTHPTDYTYQIAGNNSPTPSNGSIPTSGCYYKFEPTMDGTLNVAMLVNTNKSVYVVENGTSIGYSVGGTAYEAGHLFADKTGDILSFPVTAGKTYYVYAAGSKLGIFGWTLTEGSGDDDPSTPTTVDGTETTPTAKTSNTDFVGLCYTVPATYVGGQGNSSKAIKFNLRNGKIEINVNPNYTITGFTFTGNDNYNTTGIKVNSVNIDGSATNVLDGEKNFPTDKSENSFTISNINATNKITINTTYITAPASGQSADSQLNGTIVFTYKYNVQPLALQSSAKTSSRNGSVTLKFNNPMAAVNGTATLNGKTLTADADGTSLKFVYTGLDYGQTYTFTVPAGALKDEFDQTYDQPINITVTTDARATVTKKGFDKIVSNGEELAAAIAAANSHGSERYRIFIKNGTYTLTGSGEDKTVEVELSSGSKTSKTFANPITLLTGSNVSFIGESYENVTITNNAGTLGTYTGKYGEACVAEGIGNGDVLQISSTATESYFQGVTIKTSMGDARGRDIAVNDKSNKTIMKDVCLWGYQDTYVSNNSNGRFYFDGGVLRGRTDYLCGKGDVYYNKVTLQQVGTGGYLAVPSVPLKYGYIFNDCYIKKETSDVTYYLGRPWGKGTPIALFINTKVDAAPLTAGWDEMSGGWPDRFAEYGTKTTSGSAVSTSGRKTTFASTHSNNPVLTAAEAEYYSNMARIMGGTDGWDPTEYTEQCARPTAQLSGSTLTWNDDSYASSWVVFKDGEYYANPITNSLALTESGTYTVRAANAMGGLGEASTGVNYTAPAATYTVSYNLNGHGTAIDAVENISAIPSTLPTPTADGWAFWGWFTDEACTNAAVTGATISKNTTLYAKWSDASTTSGAWSIDFSAIGDAESLADKAGVAISSKVARINNVDMGVTKMGNTYVNPNFVIQTGTSWIYRTGSKIISSQNGGNRTIGMRSMKAGQTITLTLVLGESANDLTATNATLLSSDNGSYTYSVNADGDVSFSIHRYSTISKIEVSEIPTPPTATLFSWESTKNTVDGVTVTGGTATGNFASSNGLYVMKLADKPSSLTESNHVIVTLSNGITFAEGDIITVTGFYSRNGDAETSFGVIPGEDNSKAILGTETDWPNNYGRNYGGDGFTQVTHSYILTSDFNDLATIILTRGSKSGTTLCLTKVEVTREDSSLPSTVTATVASTRKFGSFSSLYNVDFGTDENAAVQAYTVKVKDATSVVLTRYYGVLPAGEGVVLYAPDATKSQTFNVAASATALTIDNDMIGVPVATNVDMSTTAGHAYVVNSDAFRPLSQSGTIAAGKAYIRIPSSAGAKAITMIFNDEEEATSISNFNFFNTTPSNMKIYNLQGVEVKNPIRGHIYIINNKKCIFK